MSQFLAPQIVFLKDGTDTSQGLGQLSKYRPITHHNLHMSSVGSHTTSFAMNSIKYTNLTVACSPFAPIRLRHISVLPTLSLQH